MFNLETIDDYDKVSWKLVTSHETRSIALRAYGVVKSLRPDNDFRVVEVIVNDRDY